MRDPIFSLCDRVRASSFELHRYLRHGHFEKVYENGLANRLRAQGLRVIQQHPLHVRDEDGTILGDYIADLFVENLVLIEIKACRAIADEHTAQILGYLRATGLEHGMLINFGSPRIEIRKFVLSEVH